MTNTDVASSGQPRQLKWSVIDGVNTTGICFEPSRVPGLLSIAGVELELSELFTGRKVDLRTPEDLSPYFRQDVLATAEAQYDQG